MSWPYQTKMVERWAAELCKEYTRITGRLASTMIPNRTSILVIVSNAIIPDKDIANAVLNMMPSHNASSLKSTAVKEPLPIGKVLKLNTTNCSIFKWPSVTKKNMVANNMKS